MGRSGEEGGPVSLPGNMTEEELLTIVREILGEDDMTDDDIREAYRSGMIQELCPDLAFYASKKRKGKSQDTDSDNREASVDKPITKIKAEEQCDMDDTRAGHSKVKHDPKPPPPPIVEDDDSRGIKVKQERIGLDSESDCSKQNHHKKKKKKHKKEHKKRDKEKEEKREKLKPTVILSSDSEDDKPKKEDMPRKEMKKKRVVISSSSSDNESVKERKRKQESIIKKPMDETSKKDGLNVKPQNDEKPKIHPFYQDKGAAGAATTTVPAGPIRDLSNEVVIKQEGEKRYESKEKGFSKYSRSASKPGHIRKWRPFLHRDHLRHQRKFGLKPISVVCVDLLDLPLVFHDPNNKHTKSLNSVPLISPVTLCTSRMDMIRRLERDKTTWFKSQINRRAMKLMKHSKGSGKYVDSSDDNRKPARVRIIDKIMSSASSNSDSSSVMMPSKKATKPDNDGEGRNRKGKFTKADRDADARKRKLEEVKKKAFLVKSHRDRENKKDGHHHHHHHHHKESKKDHVSKEKGKEKAASENRRRMEQARKERIQKQKNAPSISFQRILAQIDAANKEEASKPRVELKIPKISRQVAKVPANDFKVDKKITVGDVYKEVTRLLSSDVKVECPVIPECPEDLGEYTVKKIAWWFLKNEKEPADMELFHPELHDKQLLESIHEDDFDWPDDMSSIHGCVSDPEGVASDIGPDPKKIKDADWADDYCGVASLYAKIRRDPGIDNLESTEKFKSFLRIKPGTNYEKSNFEVKCFVCETVIKGQRQLGAHIRSDSHQNNFRNYSLTMVKYEEGIEPVVPRKEFIAKLVEYSVNPTSISANSQEKKIDVTEERKHHVRKIEPVRSESPGPIIGGDTAGNIEVHEMPIPDDISFASIQDYDISSDESLMNVRVAIITAGDWGKDLETRWRTWRDKEAVIAEEYNAEREYYIQEPEKHANYQEEWMKFWDQRCTELEAQGIDTDTYNFHKEWLPFWLKRMQEIMRVKVEERVFELKKSLFIDKHTLRRKFDVSAEATKRKKLKKDARGKQQQHSSSGAKSVDQGGSTENTSHPNFTRHKNNEPLKSASSPHPINSDKSREAFSRNNATTQKCSSSKLTLKGLHDRKEKNKLEYITSSESSVNNSNNDESEKHDIVSNSSNFSAEPTCRGKEYFKTVSHPPPPPVLTNNAANVMSNITEKINLELKGTLEAAGFRDLDYGRNNQHSDKSSGQERTSHDTFVDDSANKPKRVTSWSDDCSDDDKLKHKRRKQDSDLDSTCSSNTRALKERLKALREALANEEAATLEHSENPNLNSPTKRSKILPLPANEGGDGASDVSSLALNPHSAAVTSFVNKDIPGLLNLKSDPGPAVPSESLKKNSLGYHLLERRKSAEQPNQNRTDSSKDKAQEGKSKSHSRPDSRGNRDYSTKSRSDHHRSHKNDKQTSWNNEPRRHDHHASSRDGYRNKDDRRYNQGNHRNYNTNTNPSNSKHNSNSFVYSHNQTNVFDPTLIPVEESWEPEDEVNVSKTTDQRNPSYEYNYNNLSKSYSSNPVQTPVVEESWEPEDALIPINHFAGNSSATPAVPAQELSQIPVLGSTRPDSNSNVHNQWDESTYGNWQNSAYTPQSTNNPNYNYNNYYR